MSGMTKQNLFVFHTRMQPILSKDSANRGQYKIKKAQLYISKMKEM